MQLIQSPEIPEFTRESIITSFTDVLYVCLIRTSDSSDPFISAIELRSLSGSLYEAQLKPGMMLNSILRYDLGARSPDLVRYPQDRFDRLWNSDSPMSVVENINLIRKAHSNRMVLNKNDITSFPPAVVMQTAVISKTALNRLRFILEQQSARTLVVLYFAELENLNGSEARNFNVLVNEETVCSIDYALQNHSIELPFTYNYTQGSGVVISLETINQPGKSSRGPLLNALDLQRWYAAVVALLSIKRAFSLKGWISDPCFGIEWTGIRCNKGLPVRILDIDLSERNLSLQNNNLSGTIPDLCSLAKLEIIRLENNYLTGIIPDCLSHLSNLKQLNLENNNFSGVVPEGLLKKPSLTLSYVGNPHLCKGKDKCRPKRNKVGIVLQSTIGAVVPSFVAIIFLIICRRRRNSKKLNEMVNMNADQAVFVPNPVKSHSFSLVEMMRATQNLSQKIGEGGFGSVYFGKLQDGKDVAVKLLSSTSKQGATEFLNERKVTYTALEFVLLEIIRGRKPVDAERSEEEISLIKWVMLYMEMNEESGHQLTDILDKKLRLSESDFKSFYDLLALSVKCIQSEASNRPTISEIVTHIRGALISVKSDDTTEEHVQCFSFAEYSSSLFHTGR
ncbi:hypothetical protein SUGI_0017040 [Cryptomeria japonica]|nr:hypothetical protein SUGI_0017040 [Cryptomeria japonica]